MPLFGFGRLNRKNAMDVRIQKYSDQKEKQGFIGIHVTERKPLWNFYAGSLLRRTIRPLLLSEGCEEFVQNTVSVSKG